MISAKGKPKLVRGLGGLFLKKATAKTLFWNILDSPFSSGDSDEDENDALTLVC